MCHMETLKICNICFRGWHINNFSLQILSLFAGSACVLGVRAPLNNYFWWCAVYWAVLAYSILCISLVVRLGLKENYPYYPYFGRLSNVILQLTRVAVFAVTLLNDWDLGQLD